MYNEILAAITTRLDELFPDCNIRVDATEQGFETPCFFVQFLEPSEKPILGCRYFRDTGVCIQYFPEDGEKTAQELYQMADSLLDGMEYITREDGNQMRGTNRKCKIYDGILNFFVNYNGFVIKKEEPEPPMEEMNTEVDMKG